MSQHATRPFRSLAAALAAAVLAAGALPSSAATPAPSISIPAATPAATSAAPEPVRLVPTPAPAASAPAPAAAPAVAATVPAADVQAVTQPFIATITGDKVYIRSGPDTRYYEIGQVTKGDLVYVVGLNKGFYQILPPNGSFCMLDKQFVAVDASGKVGTLTGDYVNVHAGSASYKADPYAILPPSLRKGTTVKILGSTDKYYQIAPPEKSYFFISAQFVKAAPAGTEYKVAQLKLPAGVTGPTGVTVEAPTTPPTLAAVTPTPEPVRTENPAVPGMNTPPATGEPVVVATGPAPTPLPQVEPRITFSETANAKFRDANGRYQEEARKPISQQNLAGLSKDFKDILALENLSPSVKAGAQANLDAIDRTILVQKAMADQAVENQATKAQLDALHEQFSKADQAIAAAREAGPYSAEGVLQSSTIVSGKYALVNPQTGRVVAYVDPAVAQVDIGVLIGKYVGVRGISKKMEGSDIMVIKVDNASLIPQPK